MQHERGELSVLACSVSVSYAFPLASSRVWVSNRSCLIFTCVAIEKGLVERLVLVVIMAGFHRYRRYSPGPDPYVNSTLPPIKRGGHRKDTDDHPAPPRPAHPADDERLLSVGLRAGRSRWYGFDDAGGTVVHSAIAIAIRLWPMGGWQMRDSTPCTTGKITRSNSRTAPTSKDRFFKKQKLIHQAK